MLNKYETITTVCAALFGLLFFGGVFWFSGMGQWAGEASVTGGIVCGLGAWAFHALVRELDKVAEERRNKRD